MPTASTQAALEALAAALDPGDFATTLIANQDRPPWLSVTSRHADIGEDIYTADGWFWWSWAERITPVGEVPAAAAKVATVLGVVPQSSPRSISAGDWAAWDRTNPQR